MVSKIYLKAYGFKTMEDYFDYILLSKINGQYTQVSALILKMSKEQKKDCLKWFDEQTKTEDVEYCRKELIRQM